MEPRFRKWIAGWEHKTGYHWEEVSPQMQQRAIAFWQEEQELYGLRQTLKDLTRELAYYEAEEKALTATLKQWKAGDDEWRSSPGWDWLIPFEEQLPVIHYRKRVQLCQTIITVFNQELRRKYGYKV